MFISKSLHTDFKIINSNHESFNNNKTKYKFYLRLFNFPNLEIKEREEKNDKIKFVLDIGFNSIKEIFKFLKPHNDINYFKEMFFEAYIYDMLSKNLKNLREIRDKLDLPAGTKSLMFKKGGLIKRKKGGPTKPRGVGAALRGFKMKGRK